MIGQVGGASVHKKPLLTLSPDYVLKPVLTDHRGIREIAFYEAMMEAVNIANNHHRQHSRQQAYANFLRGATVSHRNNTTTLFFRVREMLDILALAFAMVLKDDYVVASELAVEASWRTIKREVELLRTLSKFTPPYYGIVGLPSPSIEQPFGVTPDTHLLLHDLTCNFSQPVVMDLKMGTQSFEPDAPLEKQTKEASKYAQQETFGFRIVGMRIYQPDHAQADESGYRFFGKHYGRSLESREQVKEALRIYFGAGIDSTESCFDETLAGSKESDTTNGSSQERLNGTYPNGTTNGQHHKFTQSSDPVNGTRPRTYQKKNSMGVRLRAKSVSNMLVQLRLIRRWFEDHNKGLLFCASSLLWIYEGQLSCQAPDVTTLKMIDFGRVRRSHSPAANTALSSAGSRSNNPHSHHSHKHLSPSQVGDPGYLQGLQTLQELLIELIQEVRAEEEAEEGLESMDLDSSRHSTFDMKTR